MIDFIYGVQKNPLAFETLKKNLISIKDEYNGTAYFGFALSELDNESVVADALIVTEEKGLLALVFSSGDESHDEEQMDRVTVALRTLLVRNQLLRQRAELAIEFQVKIYTTNKKGNINYVCEQDFVKIYDNLSIFPKNYFNALNESLDRIVSAKPKKLRKNVKKNDSLGAIIKSIEAQIANMDRWQRSAAYEIPDKPQRIRGLAGSGKTVVLALKAAYLHFMYPDLDIAVTFYTRSLYEQFKKLISDFYMQYNREMPVDFNKVHILHAWGSSNEPGLYALVAQQVGANIYSYNEARAMYGRDNAFYGACKDLVDTMDLKSINSMKMFDYILIDEAQDLPPVFFRIAYRLFKDENKKRLIYAYDELQTLNQTSMPPLKDMFGTDEDGNSLVEIGNDKEGEPRTDILLPICYRNTKWALSIAHAIGFGVYRDVESQPLVQFFEDLDVWTQIGYRVEAGKLEYNSHVKLIRGGYPQYFEDLLRPEDAVIVHSSFESKEQEYIWIVKEIKKNIDEDELDPDDILVIFPNPMNAKKEYELFSKILSKVGIESIMPDVNVDRNTFTRQGCITCTHIYRAKGNEKPMVYVADAEYGSLQSEIVQARNVLFTAITRSRAWVRITGTGTGMEMMEKEITKCKEHDYALEIDIPSAEEIKKLNIINKADLVKATQSAEKRAIELINLLKSNNVDIVSIPQLKDLAKIINGKES